MLLIESFIIGEFHIALFNLDLNARALTFFASRLLVNGYGIFQLYVINNNTMISHFYMNTSIDIYDLNVESKNLVMRRKQIELPAEHRVIEFKVDTRIEGLLFVDQNCLIRLNTQNDITNFLI